MNGVITNSNSKNKRIIKPFLLPSSLKPKTIPAARPAMCDM